MSTWTEVRVPVPWGYIAAKTYGNSGEHPMICIHGAVDNAASFDYLLPLLPQKYYYVCIDLPGHGMSSHYGPGIPYKMTDYVFVLKRIVDYFKWLKVDILGHHSGGLLAMYFASCYCDIVERVVVIDPVFSVFNEHLNRQLTKLENDIFNVESLKSGKADYEVLSGKVQMWRTFPLSPQAGKLLMERNTVHSEDGHMLTVDPRVAYIYHRPYERTHIATLLRQMKCPLLILMCKGIARHKRAFPVKTLINTFRKNCCRVEFYLLDNFNDIHINNPEKISNIINNFLDSPEISVQV